MDDIEVGGRLIGMDDVAQFSSVAAPPIPTPTAWSKTQALGTGQVLSPVVKSKTS